ncbi:ABC transporter substrate-binding protein [Acetobacterium carbinolicum]|jgi:ABC-type taurine transport system, periplasmic component|uniref:taurine ABC transporter substrate-binding protein n=1 Tax=Acetobacterium carbinolicum TaxID=52690 RepID=UPI0039C99A41
MKRVIKNKVWVLAVLVIMVVVAGLFSGCQSQNDGGALPKKVNIGYLRVPNDETVSKTREIFDAYFNELGVPYEFIVFDSGVDANKALASGSIDFATMGNTNGIIALSRGIDVELIWIHEVLGEIEGLAVKNGSNITKPEDLVGQKIATPFASTAHYSLLNYLKEAGIKDQVQLLDMQTSEIVAAWERGDINAAYTWQPTLGDLEKNGSILVSSAEMAKKGYVTANVCLVRKEFSKNYPDLVAGFVKGLSEGGDLYRSNPQEAAESVAAELGITAENALMQMTGSIWLTPEEQLGSDYMGSVGKPGNFSKIMKDTADFLQSQKSIDNSPSQEEFDAFINSTYIEMSLE